MAPTYQWGDLILIDTSTPQTLEAGQVVTVRRPDGALVTHRIVEVRADGTFITQGDANPIPDIDPRSPDDLAGVVTGHITQPAASTLSATQSLPGRLSLGIVIAGLLLIPSKPTSVRKESRRFSHTQLGLHSAATRDV